MVYALLFSVFVGGAAKRDARMMAGKYASEAPATAGSYLELHALNQGLQGKIQTAADNGDPAELAAVQDEALKTSGALHQASGRMLAGIDPDALSPREALEVVYALKKAAAGET